MRYRIVGRDEKTKRPMTLIVDAPTANDAEDIARGRGVAPESTEPEPKETPKADPATASADSGDDEPVLVRMEPGYVQTIERTGKPWKGVLLIGALLMLAGVGSCGVILLSDPRHISHPPITVWIAGGIALAGFIVFIVGRFGAWWFHG